MNNVPNINDLPPELLTNIFSYIPPEEKSKYRLTSKNIKNSIKFADQDKLKHRIDQLRAEIVSYEDKHEKAIEENNSLKTRLTSLRDEKKSYLSDKKTNFLFTLISLKVVRYIIGHFSFLSNKFGKYIELNRNIDELSNQIKNNSNLHKSSDFSTEKDRLEKELYYYRFEYFNNENREFLYDLYGGKARFEKLRKLDQYSDDIKLPTTSKNFRFEKVYYDHSKNPYTLLEIIKKVEGDKLNNVFKSLGPISMTIDQPEIFSFKGECLLIIRQPSLITSRNYIDQVPKIECEIITEKGKITIGLDRETIQNIFAQL